MSELRYDNRVVIVTGAGAGLGRAYALLFGSRGAKVVVNDLGGGRHGDGSSSKAADAVVEEIKRNGGTAVADYNSVVDGDKIVKTALDNFGRVDVVVNNAGILRDKSFPRISDQDWDLIHAVHLKGSFKVTQAAFPVMKKQGYGRIIMTSSNAGLCGNFGQANYSAAKMGLVGLASTVAIEGQKYNIHCNTIVPTAASRLTEDILPPELFAELQPELIAPVVAWLCHESCQDNGSVIQSAAGWAGKSWIVTSNGKLLRKGIKDGVSVEAVRDSWDAVTDMRSAEHMDNIQSATGSLITHLEGLRSGQTSDEVPKGDAFKFTDRDLIIYALGVGASVATPGELRFLYENDENFSPLPSYFVIPALMEVMQSRQQPIPGKEVSFENTLHGEQYLEIYEDLTGVNSVRNSIQLVEKLDKGSGSVLAYDVLSYDENGKLLFKNQVVSFIVGTGGWGGPRVGKNIVPSVNKPNRQPDHSVIHKTTLDQAALYRLSGDINPLHIDPNMAPLMGFKKPILHGLCSFGISIRLVLGAYADYDVSKFKAVKVRFVKPVYPGETLKVDMWRDGNRIFFETSVAETNQVVISGSYVDLKSVVTPNRTSANMSLQSDAIFDFIIQKVKEDPSKAKAIKGVFLYNITKDGKVVKQWTMDLKEGKVYSGAPESGVKPNTTMTINDEDMVSLATGKLNPQAAFMKGKLKVAGNVMMAQKLGPLLKAAEAKL